MFAVNIMDDYGNIQNNTKGSFFKVELYQKQRYYGKRILQGNKYKDNDGNDLENLARDIPLELCTHEHFYDIQGLQNETLHSFYDINKFDEWLCPPKNEIIKIGGVFSSEDFLYLQMSAFLCNPSVDGDKCLSDQMSTDQEEIQYKFMFFHTNFLVNRNADQIPTKAYISDFLFFHFRILYVSNWIDLYFREFQINTTYSVIGQLTSPDVSVFPIFLQGDQRTFSEYVDNNPSEKYDFELIELNLRRSPERGTKFQKKENDKKRVKQEKKQKEENDQKRKGLKPDDLEQERGFGDILKSLRNKKIKEIFKSQHINEQCLLNDEQINELYDLYQMAISENKDITVQEQNQRILQSMKDADEYYYQIFDTIKYIDFIKDEELDEEKLKKEEQLQIQLDKIKLNIKDENNIANKNGEIELQMPSSQAALKTGQNSKDNKQGEQNGKKKKRFGCI
ncbi:hypothetical protein PPERSA_13014 [Pseudocohnilembus persalinus]|uniref:Uncharacterized protein n=1 Tax=Pseudocohnilembus persalinus TaxID=266149 RepID=A0A0V0R2W6_PSEPJ|nr:hypothetical protein PPERSA_13014 [Pseudocohnilembus persalinus]|eukprot:KRX08533.1 hypothetical protein PPERSA_13014 [Pseudocohnilembus persalinus]